jgi:hypothetical protein
MTLNPRVITRGGHTGAKRRIKPSQSERWRWNTKLFHDLSRFYKEG